MRPSGAAFRDSCRHKYGFDPLTDGPLTAAERLGKRGGVWDNVWRRFAEAPTVYRGIPGKLRDARAASGAVAAGRVRAGLAAGQPGGRAGTAAVPGRSSRHDARAGARRDPNAGRAARHAAVVGLGCTGQAPLAGALRHLAALADCTERALGGTATSEIAAAYAEWGWRTDAAMLDALASVSDAADVAAVKGAVLALYRPWLEAAARAFQDSVAAGSGKAAYPLEPPAAPKAGTCILFSDALRFDVGKRLAQALDEQGFPTTLDLRLTALPSVTATAKPAVSPVANMIVAGTGLGTRVATTGTQLNAESLRNLLRDAGYQVLRGEELGEPSGRGWTELGAIDSSGHQHGWKLAQHLQAEVRELAQRIAALLDWGWQQVVVVTDHGWLLLPGGLPKAELPEHLTEVRKGRCARLKASASTTQQTVPWHWDHDVRIAVAPGIACFEAGKEYEHGGLSPQECVVPVLRVTRPQSTAGAGVTLADIDMEGHALRRARRRRASPACCSTSGAKPTIHQRRSRLLRKQSTRTAPARSWSPDDDRAGEAALLVVLAADGTILSASVDNHRWLDVIATRRAGPARRRGVRRLHRAQGPGAALQGPVPGPDLRRRVPARPLLRQHRRERDRRRARDRRAPDARADGPRGEEELFKSRARERARSSSSTSSPPGSMPRPTPTSPPCRASSSTTCASTPTLVSEQRADADRRLLRRDRARVRRQRSPRRRRRGRSASTALRPIQLSKRDVLEQLAAGRQRFTTEEWKQFLLRSVGFEPERSPPRAQDVLLLRMVPFVERNYNMVELGPRGTGKSHLFQQVSPYSHLVSGGKATVARMFVNNAPASAAWSPSTTSSASTRSPASPSTRRTASTS